MRGLLAAMVLVMAFAFAAEAGVSVTVENDFFTGSDDSYTHGTELTWFEAMNNGVMFCGLRSKMYTPKYISIVTNQPDDRPWCGVMTVFYERGSMRGPDRIKWGVELGVLGPSSTSEQQQKWWHGVIEDNTPEGWDNQLQDEPVLNAYADAWHEVLRLWRPEAWSLTADAMYGGVFGTERIDLHAGAGVRVGWNVPPFWPNGIDPKMGCEGWFAYGLVECEGLFVAHNATLGWSMFHGKDDEHNVEVEPAVGETKYGMCGGWRWFSLTYLLASRTEEFEGQGGLTDWGEVRLSFGRQF